MITSIGKINADHDDGRTYMNLSERKRHTIHCDKCKQYAFVLYLPAALAPECYQATYTSQAHGIQLCLCPPALQRQTHVSVPDSRQCGTQAVFQYQSNGVVSREEHLYQTG
jgi:hypothetical protein